MSKPTFEIKENEAFRDGEKIGFFNDPDNHFQSTRGNAQYREDFLAWHEANKPGTLPTNPEIGKEPINADKADATPQRAEAPTKKESEVIEEPAVPTRAPKLFSGRGIHDPAYFWWAWNQSENDFRLIYGVTQKEFSKGENAGRLDEVKRILTSR